MQKDLTSKSVLIWFFQNALLPANERREIFLKSEFEETGLGYQVLR